MEKGMEMAVTQRGQSGDMGAQATAEAAMLLGRLAEAAKASADAEGAGLARAGRPETDRGLAQGPETVKDVDNLPITDWGRVELGLPEDAVDTAVLADFGRAAVEMGLTPKQARALAHWQTAQIARSRERLLERGIQELAREWGSRMEGNQQAVLALVSRIDRLTGDDSFSRALGESGATCFPGVVRGLLALSRVLSEDSMGMGGGAAQSGRDESAIEGLRNAFRELRRAGRQTF